ncbi:hypothetical protein [Silvimonas iriomotensis]|nr:hypothetical protein [Silvimonas iriomotensis]
MLGLLIIDLYCTDLVILIKQTFAHQAKKDAQSGLLALPWQSRM